MSSSSSSSPAGTRTLHLHKFVTGDHAIRYLMTMQGLSRSEVVTLIGKICRKAKGIVVNNTQTKCCTPLEHYFVNAMRLHRTKLETWKPTTWARAALFLWARADNFNQCVESFKKLPLDTVGEQREVWPQVAQFVAAVMMKEQPKCLPTDDGVETYVKMHYSKAMLVFHTGSHSITDWRDLIGERFELHKWMVLIMVMGTELKCPCHRCYALFAITHYANCMYQTQVAEMAVNDCRNQLEEEEALGNTEEAEERTAAFVKNASDKELAQFAVTNFNFSFQDDPTMTEDQKCMLARAFEKLSVQELATVARNMQHASLEESSAAESSANSSSDSMSRQEFYEWFAKLVMSKAGGGGEARATHNERTTMHAWILNRLLGE